MKERISLIAPLVASLYYAKVIAPRWISLRASGGVIPYSQEVGS